MGGFIQPIFFARTAFIDTTEGTPHTMSWQSAIERTVQGLGYDLVDTERTVGGLLRVTIDRLPDKAYLSGPGEFVTVEDCELVTRQLQYVLEVDAVDYARLEVSSPGLDRPLRRPADFERFAGNDVEVALRLPFQGRRRWIGRLMVRDDGGFSLVLPRDQAPKLPKMSKLPKLPRSARPAPLDASPEQTLDFTLDEVRDARLVPVVDFKGRRRVQGDATKQDGGQGR